jgi:hypothetical protein
MIWTKVKLNGYRPLRGLGLLFPQIPGFRFASPRALC